MSLGCHSCPGNERGEVEEMKKMLKRSDVSEWINKGNMSIFGCTPLHVASRNDHLEMANCLLSSGADINCTDNFGNPPLQLASRNGFFEVVKCLLSAGADINCSNDYGCTPLHLASSNGHLEVVKCLLSSGAEIDFEFSRFSQQVQWILRKELVWRNRRSFIRFLYMLGFVPRRDQCIIDGVTGCSESVCRVMYSEDMQKCGQIAYEPEQEQEQPPQPSLLVLMTLHQSGK